MSWTEYSRNSNIQNALLLSSSVAVLLIFDWVSAIILLSISILEWFAGTYIIKSNSDSSKLGLLLFYLVTVLSLFFFVKIQFLKELDWKLLGFSYYTLKGISFILDGFFKKLEDPPTFSIYILYKLFFPTLLSGPIDRAKPMFQQFQIPRKWNNKLFKSSFVLILMGLFKKLVIADSIGPLVNQTYAHLELYNSITLFLIAIGYSIQIYADFSGYSDIAIGVSGVLGIQVSQNFNRPYLSTSIKEYWNNWHITLSKWFNEYVFVPISFHTRNWGNWGIAISIFITFMLSAAWHGFSLNYFIWGGYYAFLIVFGINIPSRKWNNKLRNIIDQKIVKMLQTIGTFLLITLGYVFFRCSSWDQIELFFNSFYLDAGTTPLISSYTHTMLLIKSVLGSIFLFTFEFSNKKFDSTLQIWLVIFLIMFLGSFRNSLNFIYVGF